MKIPTLYLAATIAIVLWYVAFDHVPAWLSWLWAVGCFMLAIAAMRVYWKANTGISESKQDQKDASSE